MTFMKGPSSFLLLILLVERIHSFSPWPIFQAIGHKHGVQTDALYATNTRSDVIHTLLVATTAALLTPSAANAIPPQKSYSTNARNMERLNAGDASGGSIYNNSPSTPAARRRRAMQGCKVDSARTEAGRILASGSKLSEKDCNIKVTQSSPDFMLEALQELDCPSCPYGIRQ